MMIHNNVNSFDSTYSIFFNLNNDDPNERTFLADNRNPFDCVLSDTIKSPSIIGSMLGTSISGIPFTRYGLNVSILLTIHPLRFGSLFRHTCRYFAEMRQTNGNS